MLQDDEIEFPRDAIHAYERQDDIRRLCRIALRFMPYERVRRIRREARRVRVFDARQAMAALFSVLDNGIVLIFARWASMMRTLRG